MAKMFGKFDASHQNSKGWTKAQMKHDEERQWKSDFEQELEDQEQSKGDNV